MKFRKICVKLLILVLLFFIYGCSSNIATGEFTLIASKNITTDSCFDIDEGIKTDSINADICLFQGPRSNSPIYLEMMNGSTQYLLDKDMKIENCKDYLSDFSITNIPDFPDRKICVQTNNNHLALLEYKNKVFYFMTE